MRAISLFLWVTLSTLLRAEVVDDPQDGPFLTEAYDPSKRELMSLDSRFLKSWLSVGDLDLTGGSNGLVFMTKDQMPCLPLYPHLYRSLTDAPRTGVWSVSVKRKRHWSSTAAA